MKQTTDKTETPRARYALKNRELCDGTGRIELHGLDRDGAELWRLDVTPDQARTLIETTGLESISPARFGAIKNAATDRPSPETIRARMFGRGELNNVACPYLAEGRERNTWFRGLYDGFVRQRSSAQEARQSPAYGRGYSAGADAARNRGFWVSERPGEQVEGAGA